MSSNMGEYKRLGEHQILRETPRQRWRGDAPDLVKTALIERLVRLGATDIPGTPRLLMRHRGPEELGALQQAVERGYDSRVTDPLMGVLQKVTNKLPDGKPKRILQKGARLVAEDPLGTLAANLVPLPGAHPAYVAGKKVLERGIDRFAPIPMPKLAGKEILLANPTAAKKVLEPGDILVTKQVNTPLWHAPLAHISKVVQGTEYDHSAMYMGEGHVANMGLKLKDQTLADFQAEYDYKAYRVKAPKKERMEAAKWIKGQIGKKSFGPSGIITQFIPSLSKMDPEEARRRDSMICSAVVAAGYPKREFGGRPILAARPVDFADPDDTRYVAKTVDAAVPIKDIFLRTLGLAKTAEELKPGDILLSRMRTDASPVAGQLAKALEFAQGGKHQHAAMLVEGNQVVHAWPGHGVIRESLDKFRKENNFEALRVNAPKRVREEAAAFVQSAVGKGYSYVDIARTLLPKAKDALDPQKKSDFICSGLIAAAYPKGLLSERASSIVRPVDIANSPHVKPIKLEKVADALLGLVHSRRATE